MSPQHFSRRLGAVALTLLAGTAYPSGPSWAQRISPMAVARTAADIASDIAPGVSRYFARPAIADLSPRAREIIRHEFLGDSAPNAFGHFSPGSHQPALAGSLSPDTDGLLGTSRATISRQPLIQFDDPDRTMLARRSSSLRMWLDPPLGEPVGSLDRAER